MAADPVGPFVAVLERLGLEYMVTGGVAASIYSRPRFTQDVNIVLQLPAGRVREFAGAFPAEEFYVPPVEALREEAARAADGHVNLIELETGSRADLYFAGVDPLNLWGLERRVRLEGPAGPASFAPVEFVIVRKLEYLAAGGSSRHEEDLGAILRLASVPIDRDVVELWAARLGVSDLWRRVGASG